MRIDDVAPQAAPAIGFVQTEIQLVDSETALLNETGEGAHPLYKKRQRARVRARLENLGYLADDSGLHAAGETTPNEPVENPTKGHDKSS